MMRCNWCAKKIFKRIRGSKYCSLICREKAIENSNKHFKENYTFEKGKEYRLKHKESIKLSLKKNYLKNKKERNATNKLWRQNHPKIVIDYNKNYNQKNKKRLSEDCRKRRKIRWRSDKKFALRCNLRKRVVDAFDRYSLHGKKTSSKEYGIDYNAIIKYLGSCPGDRKDYHIDHIRPLCSFDFDNVEEVKIAFSPENHQWLTAEENLKKSGKFEVDKK